MIAYHIKPAYVLDSRRIHRLEKEIFPKDAYSAVEIALLLLAPRSYNYKMLSDDGALIGFVSASLTFSEVAWIITLGIAKAYQRQGLGRQLLEWCEERLNKPRVRLTVRESNLPAIALYEKCGYAFVKRRWRYYHDGEDGLIMEKLLVSR